jgi:hypothetical protein
VFLLFCANESKHFRTSPVRLAFLSRTSVWAACGGHILRTAFRCYSRDIASDSRYMGSNACGVVVETIASLRSSNCCVERVVTEDNDSCIEFIAQESDEYRIVVNYPF